MKKIGMLGVLTLTMSGCVSQDMFGDLTTVSLGLVVGDNEVRRNGDENFLENSEQYRVRAGINQVITRNLTAGINLEAVADEGYLNNPYRTVRFLDASNAAGVSYQSEVYPETRNSFAVKLSTSYYLPYRAALFGHYRYFTDSWDINAQDFELAYSQPFGETLELELKARYYQQSAANFYSDLFPYRDAQNFLARDKELSDFDRVTLYRIIHALLEHGIIHKAFSRDQETYYALCSHSCSSAKHHHEHIHFKCNTCEQVSCVQSETAIAIHVPGFQISNFEIEARKLSIINSGNCA